nr:hypothetical protein [Pseudonocardia pini]
MVRRWLAQHADLRLAGTRSTRQYGVYLERLEAWGARLGVPGDQVEELIFHAQVSADGNRLWSEQFLVESDPQGEALAALDDLHTAVGLLGLTTADAAEHPLQQLRKLIEGDPTRG